MAEQSLFGTTPEALQASRAAALREQAMQYAQLDPFQRATAGIYQGANQLGGVVGGMLGGQDPELMRVKQRQSLMQGINLSEPSSIKQGIEAAMQNNDYALANELNTRYQASVKAALEARKTEAEIAAKNATALKENKLSVPADIVKAQREAALRQDIRTLENNDDPEALQTKKVLEDELSALTRGKEVNPSELATLFNEQSKLDPIKDKAKYDAYTAKIKKLTTPVKSIGEQLGEGLGLLGNALAPALKKEGEGTGEFAVKDFNTLGSSVAAGTASKRNVKIIQENLNKAFTGSFSDSKTAISSALVGLGLPVGTDIKDAVSATQLINAMGTRYVFPLVKNFPGSLAAKELDRLEKTAPNSLQQPETITRLVSLLEADIAENEFTYNRAKKYKEDKKSLIGFNQADQKIEFQQKYNQLQDLVTTVRSRKSQTSAEAAQIKALRTELGL
ncbi:hypothetical protein UFOVP371_26 [uncultured Caudovirales phage]|uniref:Uncharacterized protein n=1 Tax=uncultured Caudovirales phage TaxID=2100421 RepID=A0A6J7X131_9CAUD|nr:hypothetical protein UFOVP371_26 [uncultured Caudovirales phage]